MGAAGGLNWGRGNAVGRQEGQEGEGLSVPLGGRGDMRERLGPAAPHPPQIPLLFPGRPFWLCHGLTVSV